MSPVESPSSHNAFSLDLDDHKNEWSRHRSFLYGCDRSLEIRILKLGIKIPNLNTNQLVYDIGLEILSPEVKLCVRKD